MRKSGVSNKYREVLQILNSSKFCFQVLDHDIKNNQDYYKGKYQNIILTTVGIEMIALFTGMTRMVH